MPTWVPSIIGIVFLLFGLAIAFADPKSILRYDRRTGYAIYSTVIERGGSEEEAVAKAGRFYRLLGFVFAAIGVVACGLNAAMLLVR